MVSFYIGDIVVYPGGQGQDQSNADDADGTGKSREKSSSFFGAQIVEAEGKGSGKGHFGPAHVVVFRLRLLFFFRVKGVGIVDDFAVPQVDDAGGIFLSQLRIVGHHHHQPVFGHFSQQIHDLDAGFAVQSACGLVGQQNVRIIDQSPCNGYPLHLAAGHLIGALVHLIPQAYLFQGFFCPLAALVSRNAGNGQRQLHIGEHRLMGDEMVTLKHKADGVVAVGIPVSVLILFGRDAVDDQIAGIVTVQAADDIQKGGFSRTAGPQNGNKFIVPQIQTHIPQCVLYQFTGFVLLRDMLDLKHEGPFLCYDALFPRETPMDKGRKRPEKPWFLGR